MESAAGYVRDRCVTGIHGLDEILRGGIPYGSTVLAAGSCGCGKTTLGLEFLVRGRKMERRALILLLRNRP